jgi:hypothetical protein
MQFPWKHIWKHIPGCCLPLLFACRTVPAELPDTQAGSEPARAGDMFVETQPDAHTAPGTFAPISAEIASLYRCWFRSPYSYMFSGGSEPLEVNGAHYGMLMAGIRGILYYGNLNNCAGELTAQPPRNYADIGPIEALAGVSATVPASHLEFAAVNPEFIAFGRQHMLPSPEQAIDGVPVQLAYDRVFQRFFRLMAASLLTLLETTDIDLETKHYLNATATGSDGIEWLEGRYGGRISGFVEGWDGTTLTAPMAAGFWLRRRADGSFAAAWHGLRDVMDRYDPVWLAEQKLLFPKAADVLAQLPDPLGKQP